MPLTRAVLVLFLATTFLAPLPAAAMIGGTPAPANVAAQTALIVSTRGASCTGAVLARDLVLTAAHCVELSADYAIAIIEPSGARIVPVVRVALHPRFDPAHFRTRKPTPDLALVKISVSLPSNYRTVTLERTPLQPRAGEYFTLAGYGVTSEGDGKTAGRLHSVVLPAIGNTIDSTGVIMVRLSERGKTAGACTGDSGGPVFRGGDLAALIGWSTGSGGRGCGAVTGATLVAPQFNWIAETARALGSSLGN
jgi:secreted trypsin-like serine protease